jgi:type 2 lantibiotic biosynthesis protein LanM
MTVDITDSGPRDWTAHDDQELLSLAAALARRIKESSLSAADGSLAWIGPHNPGATDPIRLTPLGPHLYGGITGISFFLAALEHVTPSGEYRELALDAIRPLRRRLKDILADPARAAALRLGIGGFYGIPAFAYAFARIGGWLEEPDLLQEALALVALVTPERIGSDMVLDVVAGSAGAILDLLTLEALAVREATAAGDAALRAAMLCGEHLLRQRTAIGDHRSWNTLVGAPPVAGFAHGTAGISLALFRLASRLGRSPLAAAARDGVLFEDTLYDAAHGNWQDTRNTPIRYPCGWCYGAPGIALGRIASWGTSDLPMLLEDAERALSTTADAPLNRLDHLCCGNMGRVDILLCAAAKTRRGDLLGAARSLADRCLVRMKDGGDFQWVLPESSNPFDPSLMTGAAGIAYTLLRLARPAALPCLLALE